ncbi:SRPBCC family protein [Streptosporangium sp. NPDC000239]|uniref:SRPBCC family protein n=1 Tax=Streptosporangium jomthongense TaxID=1193683 RepID=A0ABV8FDX0_9ACTN
MTNSEVGYQTDGGRWTLVFVRDLRHSPESVWAALTDPAQLGEWSPYTADRDLGTVGETTLTMLDDGPGISAGMSEFVSRAEPPTLLEYTWGGDRLRWELAALGSGTRLTLRHTLKERRWMPEVAAGWHLCFNVAEHLLDGYPVGPIRGKKARDHGWEGLREIYARQLETVEEHCLKAV